MRMTTPGTPEQTSRLLMPQTDIEAMSPDEQLGLYIAGAHEVLIEARAQGWRPFKGALASIIDDVEERIEVGREYPGKDALLKKLDVLIILQGSEEVTRRLDHHGGGIDVAFDDEGQPVLSFYDQEVIEIPPTQEAMPSEEKTPDDLFAEQTIANMNRRNYYAECNGIRDLDTDTWTYYALVMPQAEYDELLASVNDRDEKQWVYDRNHGLVDGEYTLHTSLPWEDLVNHSAFVGGHLTQEAALRAAGARYIKSSN